MCADGYADVVVLGAGPAGAAAARLLALCGHSVVVLPGPPARRRAHAESLPPSVRRPLLLLEALDAVGSAGFLPCYGNTTAWGSDPLRIERFAPGEAGLQVVRADLDALLLRLAVEAGARLIPGAVATAVQLSGDAPAAGSPARVDWRGPAGAGTLRARWLIDATGRAGVLARRGLRVRDAVPPTTALLGVWRRAGGWPSADASPTVTESYRDGWAWSVPVADGRRWVAAMVDPSATTLARGAGREGLYRAELAKTRHVAGLLGGAALAGAPWACAAGTYGATRYAGKGFLLAGDAASFIDPLSSAGVKKALASGCLAGIVVNTDLRDSTCGAAALELYEERERAAHRHHAARAAQFHAAAAAAHDHPFWHARAAAATPAAVADAATDESAAPAVTRDPRFAEALAWLRAAPAARLRPAPRLRRVRRATVVGREVVLAEHLVTPAAAGALRYFGRVELPLLVDAAAAGSDTVPALFAAYERVRPGADARDLVGALSALVAWGMLERDVAPSNLPAT